MDFLYPLLNFLQPGILWPKLNSYSPMLIASAFALVAGMRMSKEQWLLLKRPALIWAVVFAVIQALSVHFGGVRYMLSTLEFWYVYPMFMAISVLLMGSERGLRRYVWGMLIGSMFVVAYGIYAKFSGINSIRVPGEYWMNGRAGAYGMYHNQNDYSFLIIQILPFLYLYWKNSERFTVRTLLLASIITCLAGILLCLSRGGMLALVLEAFLLLAYTARRRTQILLIPLFAAVAIAGIGYQWKMRAQDDGSRYTYADSEGSRLELWRAAKVMITEHPLLGVGSRRFGEYARDYYDISHDNLGKNAHNTYLDVAASSGFLGLFAFLMMLYSIVKELRAKGAADKWLDATQMAAFIAFLSIAFRALMDAKEHDWSFYTLAAIAIATSALRQRPAPAGATAVQNPQRSLSYGAPHKPRIVQSPRTSVQPRATRGRPRLPSYRRDEQR